MAISVTFSSSITQMNYWMLKYPTFILFMLLAPLLGQAQQLSNDHCSGATPILPGQYFAGISNGSATVSTPAECPDSLPTSCVKTFENDMWYSFSTESEYDFYEVIIVAKSCNTPAGLQAMIIETDDCNHENYRYRACSNKQTLDTIKLFLKNPGPDINHLIYIDGYDGTVCEYDLWLKGRTKVTPTDYRYIRFDYDLSEIPYGFPPNLETQFENNVASMTWTGTPQDDVAYYVVERAPAMGAKEGSEYMQVVGIIDPKNLVGSGEITYEFTDFITKYQPDIQYVYRIVSVEADGKRSCTNDILIQSELIETFFVGEVQKTEEKNVFRIIYFNRKKKQNYHLIVENEAGDIVKDAWLKKVSDLEGDVIIHMEEEPPGRYVFKMGKKKQFFKRPFTVN